MADFPFLHHSAQSGPAHTINILQKAHKPLKDPKFEGNLVVVVNKKRKRGRRRRKKEAQSVAIVSPSPPAKIQKRMKAFQGEPTQNNRHKRWDQYYESLFFISHVRAAAGVTPGRRGLAVEGSAEYVPEVVHIATEVFFSAVRTMF